MSWRGYVSHFDARKTVRSMDKLYYNLFHTWPLKIIDKEKNK